MEIEYGTLAPLNLGQGSPEAFNVARLEERHARVLGYHKVFARMLHAKNQHVLFSYRDFSVARYCVRLPW